MGKRTWPLQTTNDRFMENVWKRQGTPWHRTTDHDCRKRMLGYGDFAWWHWLECAVTCVSSRTDLLLLLDVLESVIITTILVSRSCKLVKTEEPAWMECTTSLKYSFCDRIDVSSDSSRDPWCAIVKQAFERDHLLPHKWPASEECTSNSDVTSTNVIMSNFGVCPFMTTVFVIEISFNVAQLCIISSK